MARPETDAPGAPAGHRGAACVGSLRAALAAGAFAAALTPAAMAAPNTAEIIVSRQVDHVELYLALPSDQAATLFQVPPSAIASDGAQVDFTDFEDGTEALAQRFWRDVDATIDQTPAEFEAMSVMVHPAADRLPFTDPFDALTAVSVCTTTGGTAHLSDTWFYLGVIAFTDTPGGAISFDLPQAPDRDLTMTLRDFTLDGRWSEKTLTVPAGAPLSIPAAGGNGFAGLSWSIPITLLFAVMAALIALRLTGGWRRLPA